ncbi:DUF3304 domain-containing protein [Chitinimonas sp. PSY-7]|uniref:DUF3304 domain-containing protein n=1 Tax=Chitinimonas sp. PSY-7 TaxID=3459088 RepID=UPI00403FD62E
MNQPLFRSAWLRNLLFAGGLALLAACQSAPPPKPEFIAASIAGLNHTPVYIASFSVGEGGGPNIPEWGGGGGVTCCYRLPYKYTPGMTAKVRWNATNTREAHWKEAIVPIEPYEDGGGRVWVHFFPEDKVRIVISNYGPGHPKHPAPSPKQSLRESKGEQP